MKWPPTVGFVILVDNALYAPSDGRLWGPEDRKQAAAYARRYGGKVVAVRLAHDSYLTARPSDEAPA